MTPSSGWLRESLMPTSSPRSGQHRRRPRPRSASCIASPAYWVVLDVAFDPGSCRFDGRISSSQAVRRIDGAARLTTRIRLPSWTERSTYSEAVSKAMTSTPESEHTDALCSSQCVAAPDCSRRGRRRGARHREQDACATHLSLNSSRHRPVEVVTDSRIRLSRLCNAPACSLQQLPRATCGALARLDRPAACRCIKPTRLNNWMV